MLSLDWNTKVTSELADVEHLLILCLYVPQSGSVTKQMWLFEVNICLSS